MSDSTPRLLLTATEAAARLGYTEAGFNKKLEDGSIPSCVESPVTYGQKHSRRFSALLLELFAAGVDITQIDETTLVRLVIEERTRLQLAVSNPVALPEAAADADAPQRQAS